MTAPDKFEILNAMLSLQSRIGPLLLGSDAEKSAALAELYGRSAPHLWAGYTLYGCSYTRQTPR